MKRFASSGEIGDRCGVPISRGAVGSVSHRHGGFEPPFDVEQNPTLVGVVSDRLHEQIMANAVKEGPDIEIEHPVLVPTTLASHGQRAVGASPRPVPVAVGAWKIGSSSSSPSIAAAVWATRSATFANTENPDPGPMILRYLNRSHRPREIAPRRHPIPQLVEVVHLVGCEIVDAHSVPRPALHCSLGPSPTPRRRDASEFQTTSTSSASVDLSVPPPKGWPPNDRELPGPFAPTPLQGPHRYYGPVRPCAPHRYSRTRSVRCLWFSLLRPKTLAVSIGATGSPDSMPAPAMSSRHLYTEHRRGHIQAAPRLRAHRGEPLSRDHPQIPVSMPSLFRFDASAVVHTCSSSHRTPAPLTARRQPQRSPPRLLTDAACGGLESPPVRRPPEDLPPSLAQHGSCRRSSTSSSLPFRTHVGAHNSVVGADQGFRAPSGDQESVRDSGHEDSASAPIAAGQRPRPRFRHPQGRGVRTVIVAALVLFGGALLMSVLLTECQRRSPGADRPRHRGSVVQLVRIAA